MLPTTSMSLAFKNSTVSLNSTSISIMVVAPQPLIITKALEAAIAAPLQSFGGEDLFPTDIEKIARIGFGLASNHAFIDGNKRIGAMVTQLLLKWNGYQFQLEQNELADMFIGIADGTKDETELRYWINDHIE